MKPDFNLCDICGAKTTTSPIFACTDRRMDAAGSNEDVGETFDLCPVHMNGALAIFLMDDGFRGYNHDAGKRLIEFVRRHKKKAT